MSNEPRTGESTVSLPPQSPTGQVKVRVKFGARTDVGKVRTNNEDQYLIARLCKSLQVLHSSLSEEDSSPLADEEGYFMLVADGMGGHAAGEHASAFVVREIRKHILEAARWFFRLDDPDEGLRIRSLCDGLERLDRSLRDEAAANPDLAGMGTTLTAASSVGADLFIIHVGDSRAYLFRDGRLRQLTTDHTVVEELVRSGFIRREEAVVHRQRGKLTNVIGGERTVRVEIHKLRLLDEDRLLLCTDGLTGPVGEEQIAEVLGRYHKPTEACRALIEAALEKGGPDNCTSIVAAYTVEG
jgi:protein phosphatase